MAMASSIKGRGRAYAHPPACNAVRSAAERPSEWFPTSRASVISRFLYILICGLLIGLQGCSTTKNSSDIPWNVPQPWEGTPNIPGL